MNFKITFKTWLKQARIRLMQDNNKYDSVNGDNEPETKKIPVDIEVENLYSETSEEESIAEISNPYTSYSKKKSMMGLAPSGSQGDLLNQSTVKKKKDHLKMFEKKMAQKLKWAQLLGSKGGDKSSPLKMSFALGKNGRQSVSGNLDLGALGKMVK